MFDSFLLHFAVWEPDCGGAIPDTRVWRRNPSPEAMDGVLAVPKGSWIFIWHASMPASTWLQAQGHSATLIVANAPAVPSLVGIKYVNGVRQSPGIAHTCRWSRNDRVHNQRGAASKQRMGKRVSPSDLRGRISIKKGVSVLGSGRKKRTHGCIASKSSRDHTNRSATAQEPPSNTERNQPVLR